LEKRKIYKEDWIGLKILDEKNGLVFLEAEGGHVNTHLVFFLQMINGVDAYLRRVSQGGSWEVFGTVQSRRQLVTVTRLQRGCIKKDYVRSFTGE